VVKSSQRGGESSLRRGPSCPGSEKANQTHFKHGPKQEQEENRQHLTSKLICVTESGFSRVYSGIVQDLVNSLCGEFRLFRKGKVHPAWVLLGKRGYILDKN